MIRPIADRPWVTLVAVAVAFALLPLFMPGGTFDLYPFTGGRLPLHAGFVDLATTVLVFSLFALGFNLLFGHTGELSFGHSMFFAIGAYCTAFFTKGFDVKLGPAHLAFAGSHNALGALVVALAIVALWSWGLARIIIPRSSGIYYSMITMAFAQVIYFIAFRWSELTGGEDGLQGVARPELPGIPAGWFADATHVYMFTAVVAFVAVAGNYWIVHSKFGSVLHAIRENKQRARFLGYDVNKYRVNAFVLSALFPGVAGWLWVYFQQSINPDAGSIDYSGRVVMMSLLGGINTFAGPMIGAFVYWDLQNRVAGLTKYWPATIGIVFALFVIVAPRGIGGGFEELRRYGIQAGFRRLFSRRARIETELAEERATAAAAGNEVAP
ncbi:MAG: branched-chain amino acid ABC transporter permease [Vulcanimicrobiaceae bacterium]